jgi:hypothetical protein
MSFVVDTSDSRSSKNSSTMRTRSYEGRHISKAIPQRSYVGSDDCAGIHKAVGDLANRNVEQQSPTGRLKEDGEGFNSWPQIQVTGKRGLRSADQSNVGELAIPVKYSRHDAKLKVQYLFQLGGNRLD